MNLHLLEKKVLITGGSKGIGKAIAKTFIEEGAKVGICARSEEGLQAASHDLKNVQVFQGDVTKADDRKKIFDAFLDSFGTIDILINNAGGSQGSTTMGTSIEAFQDSMELNYLSAVDFSKLAAEEMKKQKKGSIVNITSIYGRESGGKPTYNNAKAALISFTKSFADEIIKDGIRVNSVAPGAILHPTGNWQKRLNEKPEKIQAFVEKEIPAGRFGKAEEVAQAVVFLASEKANWVVGASLNVDGGQSYMNM